MVYGGGVKPGACPCNRRDSSSSHEPLGCAAEFAALSVSVANSEHRASVLSSLDCSSVESGSEPACPGRGVRVTPELAMAAL
eukprot:scaffold6362_cov123-Isochrysis_galbana.AAC.8